jgi:hypothetical protein
MATRRTNEEFLRLVKEQVSEEYTILSEYENNRSHVKIRHNNCNNGGSYEYTVTPTKFLDGKRRCPKCSGLLKVSQEEFEERVANASNNEYKVNGTYINSVTPVSMIHLICNNEFSVSSANFFTSNNRCPICSKNRQKTNEEFIEFVKFQTNDEYITISPYIENKKKIKFLHKKCNHEFEMRPNDFQQGNRCPHCAKLPHDSIGVQIIRKWLNERNIKFLEEATFEECYYKNKLRFDFCIVDENGNALLLIEFNGKQHYHLVFNSKTNFEEQKKRDQKKRDFSKEYEIPLLEISYLEIKEIHQILERNIN